MGAPSGEKKPKEKKEIRRISNYKPRVSNPKANLKPNLSNQKDRKEYSKSNISINSVYKTNPKMKRYSIGEKEHK